MKRLIAVGDIHGHLELIADLISQIEPTTDDQLVFLGDYIDRGPNSRGVIDLLIDFRQKFPHTVFLRGNHEQMFLDALVELGVRNDKTLEDISYEWAFEKRKDDNCGVFEHNGGRKTFESYGLEIKRSWAAPYELLSGEIPKDHLEFLEGTQLIYVHGKYIFTHACYNERLPDDPYILLWERHREVIPEGKILVVGHTPVPPPETEPWGMENEIMMDTGAAYGRDLSAMDVMSGQLWQAKPKRPDWRSVKYEPPKSPQHILLLDNKNNKEIPAYFDGEYCVIRNTKTPVVKFTFWRPKRDE